MSEKKVFVFAVACVIAAILLSVFAFQNLFDYTLKTEIEFADKTDAASDNILHDDIISNESVKQGFQEVPVQIKSEEVELKTEEKKNDDTAINIQVETLEPQKRSLGEFKLTAYCSCEKCCGEWALNRPKDENGNEIVYGSTGNVLSAGVSVAVDPSVISYGSRVEIDDHIYAAHDTGGAIKGNRIDVYFDDHQEALEFGVQYKDVYLIIG